MFLYVIDSRPTFKNFSGVSSLWTFQHLTSNSIIYRNQQLTRV